MIGAVQFSSCFQADLVFVVHLLLSLGYFSFLLFSAAHLDMVSELECDTFEIEREILVDRFSRCLLEEVSGCSGLGGAGRRWLSLLEATLQLVAAFSSSFSHCPLHTT